MGLKGGSVKFYVYNKIHTDLMAFYRYCADNATLHINSLEASLIIGGSFHFV